MATEITSWDQLKALNKKQDVLIHFIFKDPSNHGGPVGKRPHEFPDDEFYVAAEYWTEFLRDLKMRDIYVGVYPSDAYLKKGEWKLCLTARDRSVLVGRTRFLALLAAVSAVVSGLEDFRNLILALTDSARAWWGVLLE